MSIDDGRAAHVSHAARGAFGQARDASVDVARTAKDDATSVAHAARDAGVDVARSAKVEASSVLHETSDQAQRLSADIKQRARDEVARQHKTLVERAGAFAEELYTMAGEHPDTPAKELVGMLAARSTSFAHYLDQHGPEAVLTELQAFARRRPGTFIVAAVAAGFVVGRLGKGLWENQHKDSGS